MNTIQVANAPCSWGTLEFEGLEGERIDYEQMLDELAHTGYTGTELGDWGFMPTHPEQLRDALKKRNLDLLGSWLSVNFKDPNAHAEGEARALEIAKLLVEAAKVNHTDHTPVIVLGDNNGSDPLRTQHAGRITPEMAMDTQAWNTFTQGVERIARSIKAKTGLRTVFHPHCAGFVETPVEIETFLSLTDPSLVGLVLDTGHCVYGSGGNDPQEILRGLDRCADRLWYMHFKDCHPDLAIQARLEGWDYFKALRQGIFCELGQGLVDFPATIQWLHDHHYQGWVVVEQDVLPGMGDPKDSAKRNRAYLKSVGL